MSVIWEKYCACVVIALVYSKNTIVPVLGHFPAFQKALGARYIIDSLYDLLRVVVNFKSFSLLFKTRRNKVYTQAVFHFNRIVAKRSLFHCFLNSDFKIGRTNDMEHMDTMEYAMFR